MGKTRRIVRAAVDLILCLILTVSLLALCAVFAGNYAAGSKEAIRAAAKESGYTDKMREYVTERFRDISTPAGIPLYLDLEFAEDCITEETALLPLENMYLSEKRALSFSEKKELVRGRIYGYAVSLRESGELDVTDGEWQEIVGGFDELAGFYVSEAENAAFMNGNYYSLASAVQRALPAAKYAVAVFAVLAVLSAALAVVINKSAAGRLLFFYTASVSVGVIAVFASEYSRSSGFYNRIALQQKYAVSLISEVFERALDCFEITGAALIAAGMACGAVALFIKLKGKKNDNQVQGNTAGIG